MRCGLWALQAVLLLTACSEEPPEGPRPEAVLSLALARERPNDDLQQVKRIEIDKKPAFCGTIGPKAVHTTGPARSPPVEPFLYWEDKFYWPDTSPSARAKFSLHCTGKIVGSDTR